MLQEEDLEDLQEIRQVDSCKSHELFGRALCNSSGVEWEEYWPFLDCMTNLASNDGLSKLEQYFLHTGFPFIGGRDSTAWDITTFIACQEHPSIKEAKSDVICQLRVPLFFIFFNRLFCAILVCF